MVESLEWDELPLARKSLIPGRGFFIEEADGPPVDLDLASADVVVIADPDADGLTATAMVRAVHDEAVLVPTEPHELTRMLTSVGDEVDAPTHVYVLDLNPDTFDRIQGAIEQLIAKAGAVHWYDHHHWDDDIIEALEAAGVTMVIGDSDEVSTADVVLDQLGGDLDSDWSELVSVVRDHDLWLREDPRSDDIADFAYWADIEEFIEVVTEHGSELPADVLSFLEERRAEKHALIDLAVARAEYRDIGDITVGITYGRCSQNEVAQAMRETGADAGVVIKPSGGISLRGTETFQRCHEVAERIGGGGHPKAAGCKPPIFDDMLDYAHHWTTQGATSRHLVIEAFTDVLNADD